jgi:hypothetical protein
MVKMFLYLLEDIMGVTAMKLVPILTYFHVGSPSFAPSPLSDFVLLSGQCSKTKPQINLAIENNRDPCARQCFCCP